MVYTINGLRHKAQPIYRIAIVQVCTIPQPQAVRLSIHLLARKRVGRVATEDIDLPVNQHLADCRIGCARSVADSRRNRDKKCRQFEVFGNRNRTGVVGVAIAPLQELIARFRRSREHYRRAGSVSATTRYRTVLGVDRNGIFILRISLHEAD